MKALTIILLIIFAFIFTFIVILYSLVAIASWWDRWEEEQERKEKIRRDRVGEDDDIISTFDDADTYEERLKSLLEEDCLPRDELPRPPKHLKSYKSITMHHARRLDKLYSPGHRLKAFEEVAT